MITLLNTVLQHVKVNVYIFLYILLCRQVYIFKYLYLEFTTGIIVY